MMMNPAARITTADLDWWLALARSLDWTFAKTYAETAPHSYIVAGRTPGVIAADFARAAAVIRTLGQPAKYYDMTNIYLTSPDGELKWWTMDRAVADTSLINQATTDRVYGEQNAPSTHSGIWSVYDEIATDYDRLFSPVDGDEKSGFLSLLAGLDLPNAPITLDIGCGTGALLDLGITTPDRYTGVDPSQAMLNELVIKHSRRRLRRVIPSRFEDVTGSLDGDSFDLVCATFGSASYLDPTSLDALIALCTGTVLLMSYADGYLPSYQHEPIRLGALTALDASRRAHARMTRIGKFDTVLINCEGG